MFSKQIGRNMEVYVDDMFVKSKEESIHLDDLEESFTTLRQYQMKLNPSKCAFGIASRKFLGFMVSQRGIEANLENARATYQRSSITQDKARTVKEVQKLVGRIAALHSWMRSRDITRSRCQKKTRKILPSSQARGSITKMQEQPTRG